MKRLKTVSTNVLIGGKGPFDVYALDDFDFCENLDFDHREGIYVFTNRQTLENGSVDHDVYYVGKTTDFNDRFYHHHKEKQLKKVNPNCIAIHDCNKQEMDRLEVEWIEYWKPVYNIQHNS